MKALAEIHVVPAEIGISVRKQVRRAHQITKESGLTVQLHASGSNVEGELDDVLAFIDRFRETLHAEGAVRLSTAVKILAHPEISEPRADWPQARA